MFYWSQHQPNLISSVTIISDVPSCVVTYSCHSDNSRGIIYDCNIFIVQAAVVDLLKEFEEVLFPKPRPFHCYQQIYKLPRKGLAYQKV